VTVYANSSRRPFSRAWFCRERSRQCRARTSRNDSRQCREPALQLNENELRYLEAYSIIILRIIAASSIIYECVFLKIKYKFLFLFLFLYLKIVAERKRETVFLYDTLFRKKCWYNIAYLIIYLIDDLCEWWITLWCSIFNIFSPILYFVNYSNL